MTQDEINQAEWHDRKNWHGGWLGVYHAPLDRRTWVPKRRPFWGWTLNFARPGAWGLLFGLIALALAAVALPLVFAPGAG